MNIDERLERLAQRTEAIAQSVELLASFHRDAEQRQADYEKRGNESRSRVDRALELLAAAQRETEQRMAQLAESNIRLDEGMARVVNILVNHENRISGLEGNSAP
jgi:hypothetical protein